MPPNLHQAKYNSETFLTEMPDYGDAISQKDNAVRICLPSFLPTIQAKTSEQKPGMDADKKTTVVRKYLQKNELAPIPRGETALPPNTPATERALVPHKSTSMLDLEAMTITEKPRKVRKVKSECKAKHKVKVQANGRGKVGKVFTGRDRQLSVSSQASSTGTPPDLITYFSRISMRQVQATLNKTRFSILPNVS